MAADVAGTKMHRHVAVYIHATWRTHICVSTRVCVSLWACVINEIKYPFQDNANSPITHTIYTHQNLIVHRSISTTIHYFCFLIISSPFSSLLISFSHLFSNFYLNSKRNSKLSLILTSTCSIPSHAYSFALVFLLNTYPHYFSSLWIRRLVTLY